MLLAYRKATTFCRYFIVGRNLHAPVFITQHTMNSCIKIFIVPDSGMAWLATFCKFNRVRSPDCEVSRLLVSARRLLNMPALNLTWGC